MSVSKLHDLIGLAQEPSSDRRRELLREISDLFMAQPAGQLDPRQMELFDDVMGRITTEMEEVVRAELAQRLAPSGAPPPRLVRTLANDSAAVATPILRHSTALSEAELVALADTADQARLRAISERSLVPTVVSDAIIEHCDDETLNVLLRNEGAELSREGNEAAVDRAHANPLLHEAVVERRSLPADLLNEMYFVVEAQLREKIMARNAELDPQELQSALEAGRKRLSERDGVVPKDFARLEAEVHAMARQGQLTPTMLTRFLRENEKTRFIIALAALAEIDFPTARRILDGRQIDPLAIVCKAAGFERAMFLTFTILMLDKDDNAMARASEYGAIYSQLTQESANRAIRFWRLRRQSGDRAAA